MIAAVAIVGLIGYLVLDRRSPSDLASASVVDYLSARTAAAGFARAEQPRPIVFPDDAGPHPAYQTEWWYYTGNLEAVGDPVAGDRQRFGFQLTFFRRAITPPAEQPRHSDWATNQLYLAHFTVTDVAAETFHSAERLARGAAGLAGAEADPFRVWVETWSAAEIMDGLAPGTAPPTRLLAADGPVGIDLVLTPAKPAVLHGDAGLSRKGPEPGNASYYYSYPRLAATGAITTAAGTFRVAGRAWMDHEWSTSALGEDQTGWDWFSLQLDDGRELMVFQLRERGGGIAPESGGSLIDPDATVTRLGRDDFAITARDTWTSPRSGGDYPSGWRMAVPSAGLDLVIEPLVRDQELDLGFKYWEGAVSVSGSAAGQPVTGHGYVELTGYAPSAAGGGLPGAE